MSHFTFLMSVTHKRVFSIFDSGVASMVCALQELTKKCSKSPGACVPWKRNTSIKLKQTEAVPPAVPPAACGQPLPAFPGIFFVPSHLSIHDWRDADVQVLKSGAHSTMVTCSEAVVSRVVGVCLGSWRVV